MKIERLPVCWWSGIMRRSREREQVSMMSRILLSVLSGCVVCIACVSALGGTLVYSEDFETAIPGDTGFNGWFRGQVISDGINGKSYSNTESNPSSGNWGVTLNPIPGTPIIETGRIEFDLQMTTSFTFYISGNGTYWTRDRASHIFISTTTVR